MILRAALPLLLAPAAPALAQGTGVDLSGLVVRAADLDRGGSVEADEWRAFLAGLGAAEDGRLDTDAVRARVLGWAWDRDGDGRVAADDLEALFGTLDADGSGGLERRELRAGSADWFDFMASWVLFAAADRADDGVASRAEWDVLAAAAGEGDPRAPLAWIARVDALPPPADKNAVTPVVYLATLASALDSDFDGKLALADLERTFAGLDANGDGAVSAEELSPARGGGAGEVSDSLPEADAAPAGEPLMPWQRDLEDALELARRTGKPLLICVNIDGETASEALARGRYRSPKFVELARGFVPLVVSPDTHAPREHDDRGRRLPDPRFGRVVDSEHVDLEPQVYERWFDGRRVAPRHVAVSPAGDKLFDIFLVNDLSIIDRALAERGVFGVELPDPAGLSEEQLLDSPDAACRERLEGLFARADEAVRARLAGAALSDARTVQHPELLRMALLDPAAGVRRAGASAAAQHAALLPEALLLPALRAAAPDPVLLAALRSALAGALPAADEAWAGRARRLLALYAGLAAPSEVVDPELWAIALRLAPPVDAGAALDKGEVLALIERLERLSDAEPGRAELHALFAQALMRLAAVQRAEGANPTYLYEDVMAAARRALDVAGTGEGVVRAEAEASLAIASWMLGEPDACVEHAARALPRLRARAGTPLATEVLALFAEGRVRQVYASLPAGDWEPAWIADARAAYGVLLASGAATEKHAVDCARFLEAIEAFDAEGELLREQLLRFPASTDLHALFRTQVLRTGGAAALEEAYEGLVVPAGHGAGFTWFAGLAALVAAERHVQNRALDEALGAYRLSVDRFRASFDLEPAYAASAQHYVALALSGSADVLLQRSHLDAALASLREGLEASPQSSSSADGLGHTPASVAGRLQRALVREGRAAEASALRAELDGRGARGGG